MKAGRLDIAYSGSKFDVIGAFERRNIKLIKPIYVLGLLTKNKGWMKLRNKFSIEYKGSVLIFRPCKVSR